VDDPFLGRQGAYQVPLDQGPIDQLEVWAATVVATNEAVLAGL